MMNKKTGFNLMALIFLATLPIVAGNIEKSIQDNTRLDLALDKGFVYSEDCLDELILLMHIESLANDCFNDPGCSLTELAFLEGLALQYEQNLFDCIDPI